MKMKKSVLAAAMSVALAAGIVGEAAATEYAVSSLYISDLSLVLSDNGGVSPGGGGVTTYNFNLTNTADLNGSPVIDTGACSGTFGVSNTCGVATPVLNANVVNAPLSTVIQADNAFVIHAPGTGSYVNSDSVIWTSQLTTGSPTSTQQIAESQIQVGDSSAASLSSVSSTTGFTFTFVVDGENQMAITMDALLNILADINDPTAAGATAKASTNVEFKLSKNGSPGVFATFTPDGAGTGECFSLGGITCTTLFDEFDLNTDESVTGIPSSSSGRFNTVANDHFGVVFGSLVDGSWSLSLTATTETNLSRTAAVPEPGMLSLIGLALLAGVGVNRRRNRA